jgi:hypothetical protein
LLPPSEAGREFIEFRFSFVRTFAPSVIVPNVGLYAPDSDVFLLRLKLGTDPFFGMPE